MVDTDKYRLIPFEKAEDAGTIADAYGGIVITDRHSRPAAVVHRETQAANRYSTSMLRGIELTLAVQAVADGELTGPGE